MNNGLRYISENRSQDLVYCFPFAKPKNPFKKNSTNNPDTLTEQDINQQIIKSSFIAKVLCVIGCLFGIIFVILKIQGQNSMLQEYLFNVQTLKISLTSYFFCIILFIVIIGIFIYQINLKETLIYNNIGLILLTLFIISFIVSAATLSYFLFIYFKNGYYLVLSSTLCFFIINIVLAIYVWYKKQEYKPLKYGIYSIILNFIFSLLSIFQFADIWWNILICGILIIFFELLIIHSATLILEEIKLNLTEKDYIIAVPIIFGLNVVSFLALILIIVIIARLVCKSNNSEGQDDDDDDDDDES